MNLWPHVTYLFSALTSYKIRSAFSDHHRIFLPNLFQCLSYLVDSRGQPKLKIANAISMSRQTRIMLPHQFYSLSCCLIKPSYISDITSIHLSYFDSLFTGLVNGIFYWLAQPDSTAEMLNVQNQTGLNGGVDSANRCLGSSSILRSACSDVRFGSKAAKESLAGLLKSF